jgi:hypothetical protein
LRNQQRGDEERTSGEWPNRSEAEWQEWGQELGEKIGWWAMELGHRFEHAKFPQKDIGLLLQTGNGNVDVEDIEAKVLLAKLGRGNLKMKDVYLNNLAASVVNGNLECKSAIPSGDWNIKTTHGNVQLSLPSNIAVRLDMATRHGNIESGIPLVRVARQGPESNSGMRMVGTAGTGEGEVPRLQITALYGNIKIESGSPVETLVPAIEGEQPALSQPAADQVQEPLPPQKEQAQTSNNTPLIILKALEEGQISVSEAERLLHSLEV